MRGREGTGFHQLQDYSELAPQCFYTVIVGVFFFYFLRARGKGLVPRIRDWKGGKRRLGLLPTAANPHKRERKKPDFFFFLSNPCGWVFFKNVVVLLLFLIKYLVSTVCRAQ